MKLLHKIKNEKSYDKLIKVKGKREDEFENCFQMILVIFLPARRSSARIMEKMRATNGTIKILYKET